MGEYAKTATGERVKIGTCEDMYYLRLEDANKVIPLSGNVNPATDTGLRFRLPFPDEDSIEPGGNYEQYNRGLHLYKVVPDIGRDSTHCEDYDPEWLKDPGQEPGIIQLHHQPSGLLINVPCYHGTRLPDVGPKCQAFWNGKGHSVELSSLKRCDDGTIAPVVRCIHCQHAWRTDWAEVMPYVANKAMYDRLSKYATGSLPAQR